MSKWIPSVLVCLVLCTPAYAQTLGTITGEVKDESGATVPGATVTAQNVATNAVRTQVSNVTGELHVPGDAPGHVSGQGRAAGVQDRAERRGAARRGDAARGLHARGRRVDGNDGSVRHLDAHLHVECDGRDGHRESADRGVAPERTQLPEPDCAEPERQRRVRGRGPGGRSSGRLARQPADLHLGPAARVQLLHARRRRQHRRQFQHLHLPAVGGRARGVQGADRHLFGRVRPRRRPGQRRHQVGLERLPWHGLRVPPQRQVRRAAVRLHGRAGRRAQGPVRVASVRLHGRGPGAEEPAVLHVELRGVHRSQDVPQQLQPADRGDAARRLLGGRHAAPRSVHVHGRRQRPVVSDVPGQRHSGQSHSPDVDGSARVLSGAEHVGRGVQLPLRAEPHDRPEAVHAAHGLRAGLGLELDGPLQLRPRR